VSAGGDEVSESNEKELPATPAAAAPAATATAGSASSGVYMPPSRRAAAAGGSSGTPSSSTRPSRPKQAPQINDDMAFPSLGAS